MLAAYEGQGSEIPEAKLSSFFFFGAKSSFKKQAQIMMHVDAACITVCAVLCELTAGHFSFFHTRRCMPCNPANTVMCAVCCVCCVMCVLCMCAV